MSVRREVLSSGNLLWENGHLLCPCQHPFIPPPKRPRQTAGTGGTVGWATRAEEGTNQPEQP